MANLTSLAFDTDINGGDFGVHRAGTDDVAQTALVPNLPQEAVLQLHRYLWLPGRYAHRSWLAALGFMPKPGWQYGQQPQLDSYLNQALRARRGTPRLPTRLNTRQQRMVRLAPKMTAFALAIGLLKLGCSDYLLLPDYRQTILRWLDDGLIWLLFGLSCGKCRALFSPIDLITNAIKIGTAVLHRAAQDDPVLYAVLIMLPPCERALWPQVPMLAMNLLEQALCPDAEYR
ncbi:type III secretion system domain-containing protein [Yersinia aldovae]|uniref:type III secretion system domain-containing protein n=1 Tax=Yersinia aldovae TaxID=29483 RepID=UPI001E47B8B9|nr:type III secretion system domain-containing protein [Yersinia aldovae]